MDLNNRFYYIEFGPAKAIIEHLPPEQGSTVRFIKGDFIPHLKDYTMSGIPRTLLESIIMPNMTFYEILDGEDDFDDIMGVDDDPMLDIGSRVLIDGEETAQVVSMDDGMVTVVTDTGHQYEIEESSCTKINEEDENQEDDEKDEVNDEELEDDVDDEEEESDDEGDGEEAEKDEPIEEIAAGTVISGKVVEYVVPGKRKVSLLYSGGNGGIEVAYGKKVATGGFDRASVKSLLEASDIDSGTIKDVIDILSGRPSNETRAVAPNLRGTYLLESYLRKKGLGRYYSHIIDVMGIF